MKTWQIVLRFARDWQSVTENYLPFSKTHVSIDKQLSCIILELNFFSGTMRKMIAVDKIRRIKINYYGSFIAQEMCDQMLKSNSFACPVRPPA